MKLKNITILLILFLSSCTKYQLITPNQIKLPNFGSRMMLQGARDGCDTAHASRGNSLYRSFFRFTQKPQYITDDEYFDSWYRGYIYCFHIINRNAHGSIDSYMTPEHGTWFFKTGMTPKIDWAWQQGVDINVGGEIQFPGHGEAWWNTKFIGNNCNGFLQC